MNDSVLIWEKYTSLHEANLISKDPLHLELEKILKEKGVQKQEISNWFLKTYIKWFQSPADDNQKTGFISPYQAKDNDPEWAKKEGIYQFNQFTPEYRDRLSHLIDFLNTKDENYLKSLFKVTVPQIFQEVGKWDQEMKRSSEKAKKAKLQSVDGVDYEVVGVYDNYPIWKLISNKAFREESMYMGHCVGQAEGEDRVTSVKGGQSEYFKQYKQGELIIYSLRDPKEHNHPAVTFELEKVYGEKTFKIVQIKGPANREVSKRYRKACREFIEDKNLFVQADGANIGMVKWRYKFYFEDTEQFQEIYKNEIIPKQQETINAIFYESKMNNGIIKGYVSLDDLFLKELPDFSNIIIKGSFYCIGNQLTTLKGSPKEVGGNFYCSKNRLTTLEGAPKKVGGDFNCYNNRLTTLEGAPKKVGGDFDCTFNRLTTLEGAPQEVGKNFNCFYNPVIFTQEDIDEAMQKSREQNSTKLESFKTFFTEACWDGYKRKGMKQKGKGKKKRMVPDCVPK
jgi:hypothetical protein